MKIRNKKIMATAITTALLSMQTLMAGDVEISLPTAADAFTVDQPAGTELMRVNGDGKVGIGTATPSATLDVVGTMQYVDGNEAAGFILTSDAGGNATWQAASTSTSSTPAKGIRVEGSTQSIPSGASTKFTNYSTTVRDDFGAGMTNGDWAVPTGEAGWYSIVFNQTLGYVNNGGTFNLMSLIYVNGSMKAQQGGIQVSTTPASTTRSVSLNTYLNVGDVVSGYLLHNRGAATDSNANLAIVKITDGSAAAGGSDGDAWGVTGEDQTSTIGRAGNVGIGTTTPTQKLTIVNSNAAENDATLWITQNSSSEHTMTVSSQDILTQNAGLYLRTQAVGTIKTGTGADLRLGAGNSIDHLNIIPNGNVGIGTTTPQRTLHISGSDDATSRIQLQNESAAANTGRFDWAVTEGGYTYLQAINDAGAGGGNVIWGKKDAATGLNIEEFGVGSTASPKFYVNTSTGKVGIGTTTPTTSLEVNGGIRTKMNDAYDVWIQGGATTAGGNARNLALVGTTSPGWDKLILNWNGEYAQGVQIQSDLSVAGSVTETSDERLKKDIKPVVNALDKIKQLQGVTFKWKDATGKSGDTKLGLIAQQVEKVVPEVVETANDEMKTKSVSYSNLVAMLIEGMKEQQERIEALEAHLK